MSKLGDITIFFIAYPQGYPNDRKGTIYFQKASPFSDWSMLIRYSYTTDPSTCIDQKERISISEHEVAIGQYGVKLLRFNLRIFFKTGRRVVWCTVAQKSSMIETWAWSTFVMYFFDFFKITPL